VEPLEKKHKAGLVLVQPK